MKNTKIHVKEILKERKKMLVLVLSALLLVLTLAGSYAFFTSITNNDHKQEAKLATGTMALTFKDGNNGVSAQLMLGESVTKKFIIENTGSLEASLSLDWDQLINTYMDGSLTYRLVRTENDVEVEEIIPKTNMPVSSEKLTQTLASELSVPAKETYYYDLIITFNNLDVDQESDKEAVYNTHFNVGLPLKYRYYALTINPNGGTWKEFTTTQSYLLKNNETLSNITNPTKVGYTFDGWEIKGTSSTFDSGTFTMGIADSSLTAKWTTNKYTVTINPNGGEYDGDRELSADYGSTITLSTPTKTGYTFSHWETTGGTITNKNTLTISDPSNITVTANWTPNKYSYIVKHNKQNIDGNGYTTFETETIENIDYGTEVTPEFKEYDGFTEPTEKKTITIKEDNSLNIVEYNYTRNQYTLTVNPDGGTGGTTTQEVYYEKTVNLTAPTKIGYDFQKWTVESGTGTLSDNTFKMGLGDTTIKANWKEQEYSLTFNANGGTVTPESKKITYNSTYGELPTPTKDGYVFTGWYTTNVSTGGTEITSSTTVTIISNQTIYARWKSTLLAVESDSYTGKMWEHKYEITKIIFENKINAPSTYAHSYDISNNGDSSIMSYLVTDPEDSTKYIAHIQSNGKIYANPDSSYLFYCFYRLKTIEGLENLDTSNVTNMKYMFFTGFLDEWYEAHGGDLISLDVSHLNTSKVTDMSYMFAGCQYVTNIDVSGFDTSNVTNMDGMFYDCNSLTNLNVSEFDTSNVTDMSYMFCSCRKLTALDVSNFDTSNVTNMSGMLYTCNSLLTNLDVSGFNTSKVTNMEAMFSDCSGVTSLDLSHFDTSNVTDMMCMFQGCESLTGLDLSHFNTSKVTNMERMFSSCSSFTSLDLSSFNTSNVTNMTGMFSRCSGLSLTSLNISNLDTSNVTNMTQMFYGCNGLTNWKVDNFNTSKVTKMHEMFGHCINLVTVDLSNLNMSSVTDMSCMFSDCSSLANINLSNLNTCNLTSLQSMFRNCSSLTTLDLSSFNTSKVTDMYTVFQGCSNLATLNLQNWDVSSVKYNSGMFYNILSSIKITVSNTTMRTWVINTSDTPKLTTTNFTVKA